MTEGKLQQIRERVEKASPGPWHLGAFGIHTGSRDANGDIDPDVMRADMEFMAHAREDIPALLEAYDVEHELRLECESWEQHLRTQRDALQAENKALREIVQAVANMDPISAEARAISGVPSWRRDAGLIAKARAIVNNDAENNSK